MDNVLIKKLARNIFDEINIDYAYEIYNEYYLEHEIEKYNLYENIVIASYYVLIKDIKALKQSINMMEKGLDELSKYEKYFYYYFNGVYFYLNKNYEAALFSLKLIDLNKFKRYINFNYKLHFYGEILFYLARLNHVLSNYNIAHDYYTESIKVFNKIREVQKRNLVEYNLDSLYISIGDFNKALDYGYDLIKHSTDLYSSLVLQNITIVEIIKGNLKKALFNYNLINMNKLNKEDNWEVFNGYNDYIYVGSVLYYLLGQKEKSIKLFNSIDKNNINNDVVHFIIDAYINEDYSDETVHYIEKYIYPKIIDKNSQLQLELYRYYENKTKSIIKLL